MADILLEQTVTMASSSSKPSSESPFPFSFLGRLFTGPPSRSRMSSIYAGMCSELEPERPNSVAIEAKRPHSRMSTIYAGMCSELEPERPHGISPEAWNASTDSQAQQQRSRSDSDLSATTVEPNPAKSPVFSVPKWTWPERKASSGSLTPVTEPLKPSSES